MTTLRTQMSSHFFSPDRDRKLSAWAKNSPSNSRSPGRHLKKPTRRWATNSRSFALKVRKINLRLTEITQPAILTVSVAAWRVLNEKGLKPGFVAGHSLGEYSAHVAAGTISFADAVRTVRNRGKYMQEAVPVGVGAMAAILGMELDKVAAVCGDAAQGEVCEPANINSPEQIVISGHMRRSNAPPNWRTNAARSGRKCFPSAHPSIVR